MSLYWDRWWWPTHKISLNNNEISSSKEEKLLRIPLDSKLIFDYISLSKKAGQNLSALARINHYLAQDQMLLLLNSVVKSSIQLLSIDLDVYFSSIFKQCIKQYSRKSLTFDLRLIYVWFTMITGSLLIEYLRITRKKAYIKNILKH